MKVSIPREIAEGETRVAIVPAMVGILKKAEHEVFVESDAGLRASFSNSEYEKAGATIIQDPAELYAKADIVLKFQTPKFNQSVSKHEVELLTD